MNDSSHGTAAPPTPPVRPRPPARQTAAGAHPARSARGSRLLVRVRAAAGGEPSATGRTAHAGRTFPGTVYLSTAYLGSTVFLGTALIGARARQLGLHGADAGWSAGADWSAGAGWSRTLLSLLCTAGVLAAVAGTARALPHLHGRPVALLAACAIAGYAPALAWLFTGTAGPVYALAVALLTRVLVGGITYGRLLCARTAVSAGLLVALAAGVRPDAAGFAAAYPLLVLLRLPRGHPSALLRAAAGYALSCALPWGALLLWRQGAYAHPPAAAEAWAGVAVVPLLTAAVLALALTRGGRGRRAVGALLWLAERPYVRAPLTLAVVGALVLSLTAHPSPGAPATAPAPCSGAARYGPMFAEYAHRLGLARSTVALAMPRRAAPPADGHGVRFLDLNDRTDPRIAAAYAAHDTRALRSHVLDRIRPEFIHTDGRLARRTGLTPARLAAHGYRPLLREQGGGDYVHRSALTTPERLSDLRDWARSAAQRLSSTDRRGSVCG